MVYFLFIIDFFFWIDFFFTAATLAFWPNGLSAY